jgi:diguanylate cyclase (GGDEF)-like protein
MITGAPANYLNGGSMLQWALLLTTVLQGGITVAFVWMTTAVLHEKLRALASTDPLTGLLNRRALETGARSAMALSLHDNRPLAAILVDLDQFKNINDSFGHSFGDMVLTQVAEALQSNMRTTDLLGRIGGDEFAIVLQNTDHGTAQGIAERVRESLASLEIVDKLSKVRVSASIGLAQLDRSTLDWEQLIVHCDRALYAVKEAGGNLVLTH